MERSRIVESGSRSRIVAADFRYVNGIRCSSSVAISSTAVEALRSFWVGAPMRPRTPGLRYAHLIASKQSALDFPEPIGPLNSFWMIDQLLSPPEAADVAPPLASP